MQISLKPFSPRNSNTCHLDEWTLERKYFETKIPFLNCIVINNSLQKIMFCKRHNLIEIWGCYIDIFRRQMTHGINSSESFVWEVLLNQLKHMDMCNGKIAMVAATALPSWAYFVFILFVYSVKFTGEN